MTAKFALRYLFSKKKTQAINVLSYISMGGMAIGAMALIVILSIFNGFEDLVISLYNSFQPSIKIETTSGKYFKADSALIQKIKGIDGITTISLSLEENAYFKYHDKECIGTLKGVDAQFNAVSKIDSFILDGSYQLSSLNQDNAIMGSGIQAALNASLDQGFEQISVYLPKKGTDAILSPEDAFNTAYLSPTGVFSIQQEFDEKYVLAPLSFVQYLSEVDSDKVSSLELKINESKEAPIMESLSKLLGKSYIIKNRLQQNEALYRVMKIERLAVIAILAFVVGIISFNILGSIMMLIIEKEKDIAILAALGTSDKKIFNLFLLHGVFQSIFGAIAGISLGLLICWIQKTFGVIKLGGGSFVVDAYPVVIKGTDIILVFCIIVGICFLASIYPAKSASKKNQYRIQ